MLRLLSVLPALALAFNLVTVTVTFANDEGQGPHRVQVLIWGGEGHETRDKAQAYTYTKTTFADKKSCLEAIGTDRELAYSALTLVQMVQMGDPAMVNLDAVCVPYTDGKSAMLAIGRFVTE